jgi:hypothetical protein
MGECGSDADGSFSLLTKHDLDDALYKPAVQQLPDYGWSFTPVQYNLDIDFERAVPTSKKAQNATAPRLGLMT